jgi:predicted ATPase
MILRKFSIENYRSIKEIKDHSFHDDRINCLIGQNGSGKSNVLQALASLKETKYLVDDSLNEDSGFSNNKSICLEAEFLLEKEDIGKLKELGLKDTTGFVLKVEKNNGDEITRSISPLGYVDERPKELKKVLNEIEKELKQLSFAKNEIPVPAAQPADPNLPVVEGEAILPVDDNSGIETIRTELLTQIEQVGSMQDIDSYSALGVAIGNFIAKLDQKGIEHGSINSTYESLNLVLSHDVQIAIMDLFKNLAINILDLSYEVEGIAAIKDLSDAENHPFLSDMLKLAEVSANDFSSKSGRNLARLQNSSSEKITDEVNRYWLTHPLKYRIERHDGNLCFFFYTRQGAQIELNNLSEGEKWYLKFFVKLAIANKENKKIIWLFDEPGQNLHASSQIDLKNFFEDNAKNSQIIYSTHQPMMMQWHRLERLYVVDNIEKQPKKEKYGTILHQRFWQDSELASPLREALGLFIGEELLTGKEHIVIEGISDYFYMIGWLRYFQKNALKSKWLSSFNDSNRTFIPADGKDNIPIYCLFLTRKTKNKINCIAIPDSKNDSDEIKTTLEKHGLSHLKESTRDLATLSGQPNLKDIEELFDPTEYLGEVEKFYAETYPNVKISNDFTSGYNGKIKIIEYIDGKLLKANPELFALKNICFDKTGVAQFIHDKLVWNNSSYSKIAQKNFEKVFSEIDKMLKKKIKQDSAPQ